MTAVKFRRVQHVSIPMPPGGASRPCCLIGCALGLVEKQVPASLDGSEPPWSRWGKTSMRFIASSIWTSRTVHRPALLVRGRGYRRAQGRVSAAGIAFDHDPSPIHSRPRSFVRDPFGNQIELTQITGDSRRTNPCPRLKKKSRIPRPPSRSRECTTRSTTRHCRSAQRLFGQTHPMIINGEERTGRATFAVRGAARPLDRARVFPTGTKDDVNDAVAAAQAAYPAWSSRPWQDRVAICAKRPRSDPRAQVRSFHHCL